MRVAYLCADLGVPVFGRKGCSVHVQEVVRALKNRGADVELFAMCPDGEPPPGLESVRTHSMPAVPRTDRAAREQAALAANRGVRAALEHEGPFDLVYERYSLWNFAGMEYARDRGTPGLLEVNAPLIDEQAEYRELADRAGAERVAARVFGAAAALLAVSEELAAYLERHPAARGRVHVVPNGVNPDRFPPGLKPSVSAAPGVWTVGFVGSFKPWHGLSTLIEAFDRVHQSDDSVRLLLVGDGPGRANVEADLAARSVSKSVYFAGAVDPGAVPGLLASMDVAVAPYPELPCFYFSPLKVYEYMAAGRPVVASRVGQLGTLIRHWVNGLLCPPGDPAALAEALTTLRQSPELRCRLGQAARTCALREHTWDAVAERIFRLADRTVTARPHSAEAGR
jgi:glycosyltransferase involved in cell wall biosynthesis